MSKPRKASHCNECRHFVCLKFPAFLCEKGHKPRFYQPIDCMDTDWGWKRRCEDFQRVEE